MTTLPEVVSAEVPATPDFVQVLRNVAAGVAARADMPIDQIEEIRLAVTEAASLLLTEALGTTLRMSIRRDADVVDVELSSDGTTGSWRTDRIESSWAWIVVSGLTDEVALDREGAHPPSIAFVKRRDLDMT
ncbi:MAG TPA: ATP-binding protein [Actinomycetota bacterium]|nr:ATP-binding protein [Actinomycetota bacterium]